MMMRPGSSARWFTLLLVVLILICSTPTPPVLLPEAAVAETAATSVMSRSFDTGVPVTARSFAAEREHASALQRPDAPPAPSALALPPAAAAILLLSALFAAPPWSRRARTAPSIARRLVRRLLDPVRSASYAA
ncbi:hypothetical protein HGI30_04395 [Paenibacillus albicereus]|uniref:Uncharacterized protein n=1 Tax=Paenibacillus albicereus TaxID=2726185 RepID=A0A6H2GUN0_9BACL|nr:hypothetical protein [Paenibacillus albicereus]QJC50876.1 hypothetical protein HGI30_04395 [Paenibacillus albicereus]